MTCTVETITPAKTVTMKSSDLVKNTEAAAMAGDAQAQYEFATVLRVGKQNPTTLGQSLA